MIKRSSVLIREPLRFQAALFSGHGVVQARLFIARTELMAMGIYNIAPAKLRGKPDFYAEGAYEILWPLLRDSFRMHAVIDLNIEAQVPLTVTTDIFFYRKGCKNAHLRMWAHYMLYSPSTLADSGWENDPN